MWNESFRHCLASLGNTKEKCSLLLSRGGEIFFEKGKDIFLWCSALKVSGRWRGDNSIRAGFGFLFWRNSGGLISISITKLVITILTDIFNKINSATNAAVGCGQKSKLLNVGTGSIYRLVG